MTDANVPDVEARRIIRQSAAVAAVLGAVLSPVPFADEIALVPLFASVTLRVARVRGMPPKALPLAALARTAIGGLAARAALNAGVAFIPGVAAVANAVSAAALTAAYGSAVDRTCRGAEAPSTIDWSDVLDRFRRRAAA